MAEPETTQLNYKKGINLLYAIGVSVGIALIMVIVATFSFYHSGAFTTVKQIQTGTQFVKSIDKDSLDVESPINASDIEDYAESIKARLKTLDDNSDFGPDDVSDAALGLR
jgi:hypothetical protein